MTAFGIAVVLLVAFTLIERRQPAPLLPDRILANRTRAVVYLVALIVGLALYALALYLMLYLQQVLGYSSLQAGLAFLALAIPIGFAAIGMGRSITRIGTRGLALLGTVATTIAQRHTNQGAFALSQGYRATFYATGGFLALAFVLTATLLPKKANAG